MELDERVHEVEQKFAGGEIPLPPFWGGFQLTPSRIEICRGVLTACMTGPNTPAAQRVGRSQGFRPET